MGSQWVGHDLVTGWTITTSCQSFANGTFGDVADALWTWGHIPWGHLSPHVWYFSLRALFCAFTHLRDCDVWSSSFSQLPTVLWLLFPTPHLLYFLEDFLHGTLSRTLSSECLVISLTVHSPFVESGACLSWCWISSCPRRVTLAGSPYRRASLLLCPPEGQGSGQCLPQCGPVQDHRLCTRAERHPQKVIW